MSFNSKAYLADRERLLEPDTVLIKGNRKKYEPIKVPPMVVYPVISEYEQNRREDEYLKKHNVC